MRTATFEIEGKKHLLCFSIEVAERCAERFGDLEKMGENLSSGGAMEQLRNSVWLLAEMMQAGDRYAGLTGRENPEPYSMDELRQILDVPALAEIKKSISLTLDNGMKRKVETQEPKGKKSKNGDAAPAP